MFLKIFRVLLEFAEMHVRLMVVNTEGFWKPMVHSNQKYSYFSFNFRSATPICPSEYLFYRPLSHVITHALLTGCTFLLSLSDIVFRNLIPSMGLLDHNELARPDEKFMYGQIQVLT